MNDNEIKSNIKENWEQIKKSIKEEFEIPDIAFNIWIDPLKYVNYEKNTLTISIPSNQAQMVEFIKKKYETCFIGYISENIVKEFINIQFISEPEISEENNGESSYYNDDVLKASNLNSKYKFESFVVGSNNNMAHSACLAVAESPGKDFNPLFIYGGSGLGKTHLMNSIGHYIVEHYKNMKVLYVTSEDFTNEVIESIRLGNSNGNTTAMTKLRDKYRSIDVLLIDDIQFIIGKQATQEEFFHTFNALHSAGKAIIISSDKHPKEMTTLDERFRSRFEWGLIVDIQPPVYETRVAILRKYAKNFEQEIPNEVIDYIATNIKSNVRELEGALNKVNAYSKINQNRIIDLELAKNALKDTIFPDKPTIITPNIILEVVAEHYGINPDDIVSKKRSAEIATPRHVFMYLCKDMTDLTLKAIGALTERDHSTVLHAINKIETEVENNPETREKINVIKNKIISI